MNKFARLALCALALIPVPAFAFDWSAGGKVTLIEVSYAPLNLLFRIDQAAGSCPAGSWLTWTLRGADTTERAQNYQAVLSAVMTAKSTGQSVTVFGSNSGCTVDFLYLS